MLCYCFFSFGMTFDINFSNELFFFRCGDTLLALNKSFIKRPNPKVGTKKYIIITIIIERIDKIVLLYYCILP